MAAQAKSIWDPQIVRRAIADSFWKLHPRTMARNPVMFVVEIGSVLTTIRLVRDIATGGPGLGFEFQITFWLWLTVLFANFAEAMAEGRGKAQADALRTCQDRDGGQPGTRRTERMKSCRRQRSAKGTSCESRPAR